jgi:hypothetical protein
LLDIKFVPYTFNQIYLTFHPTLRVHTFLLAPRPRILLFIGATFNMDDDYERLLPDRIFGLSYWQHRVHQTIQFLTYNKAKFNRKARKAQLLNHLAALEKTFFTPEEQEGISAWFRAGRRTAELEPLIGAKREDANFVKVECSVCMAVLPSYYFPREKLAANCDHEPSVCLMCFAQSLEQQIEEKAWDQVACPECPERLTFNVVEICNHRVIPQVRLHLAMSPGLLGLT